MSEHNAASHTGPIERDPPAPGTGYTLLLLGLLVAATIFACTGLAWSQIYTTQAERPPSTKSEKKKDRADQEAKLKRIEVGIRRVIAESRER